MLDAPGHLPARREGVEVDRCGELADLVGHSKNELIIVSIKDGPRLDGPVTPGSRHVVNRKAKGPGLDQVFCRLEGPFATFQEVLLHKRRVAQQLRHQKLSELLLAKLRIVAQAEILGMTAQHRLVLTNQRVDKMGPRLALGRQPLQVRDGVKGGRPGFSPVRVHILVNKGLALLLGAAGEHAEVRIGRKQLVALGFPLVALELLREAPLVVFLALAGDRPRGLGELRRTGDRRALERVLHLGLQRNTQARPHLDRELRGVPVVGDDAVKRQKADVDGLGIRPRYQLGNRGGDADDRHRAHIDRDKGPAGRVDTHHQGSVADSIGKAPDVGDLRRGETSGVFVDKNVDGGRVVPELAERLISELVGSATGGEHRRVRRPYRSIAKASRASRNL